MSSEIVEIVAAYGDDWEGLYCNGELVNQGHMIGENDGVLFFIHPLVNGKFWT